MSDKVIEFPSERDDLNEIFDALFEIGEVVENDQAEKEAPPITCPHCGKTFSVEK